MKGLFLKSIAATIVCAGMVACGENPANSSSSEIPSDGILGSYGPEIYEMMTDIEFTIPQTINELQKKLEEDLNLDAVKNDRELENKYKANERKIKDVEKQCEDLETKQKTLREELKQKVQEASEALSGKEIPTMIETEAPLKLVEPFKITKLSGTLLMDCECIVELTEEYPADYLHRITSSLLMTASCENDSNKIVPAYSKTNVSIVGGSWPDDMYPAGTQFIVRTNVSAGISSNGISKGLFQIHHITVHWAGNRFNFNKKKLGPIEVGRPISNLPASFPGLYDKFRHKKELHEDEMDGEWLEENYTFSKDGKDIFMAIIYEDKVSSIRLLKDATFISTPDGISVGSSAREVFNKIRADWSTYYEGTAFATKGNFTYHISMDDLIRADVPHNTEQIKPDAKICMIECQ